MTKDKLFDLAENVAINIRDFEEEDYLKRVSEIVDLVQDLKNVDIDELMYKTTFLKEQELREDVAVDNDMELMKENHFGEDNYVTIKSEGL